MTSHFSNGEPLKISSRYLKEMLDMVKADREARQVFLNMPREDQLLAILGMIAFTNNELANMKVENIEYRNKREREESSHNQSLEDTGARIAAGIRKELEGQFGPVYWFRDKVLPGVVTAVVTAIVLAILYLTFGPK